MGSLEGFVVLKLPQYFLQRARKLAQNLLNSDSDLIETSRHAASSPLTFTSSQSTAISSRLHHSPLSRLALSTDRSRPLSSPPPPLIASRRRTRLRSFLSRDFLFYTILRRIVLGQKIPFATQLLRSTRVTMAKSGFGP
jgi:hypothetical protein